MRCFGAAVAGSLAAKRAVQGCDDRGGYGSNDNNSEATGG